MLFNELRSLFLACNPLGHIWINDDDNVCIQAHSTAPIEIFKGTHDVIAIELNLVSSKQSPNLQDEIHLQQLLDDDQRLIDYETDRFHWANPRGEADLTGAEYAELLGPEWYEDEEE